MDPSKLETMSKRCIAPKKKEVQVFVGFANYYGRFIVNYIANASPPINITKDVSFTQGYTQWQAFDELQVQFLSASILTQFDRTFETTMETDASNLAIAAILSQYHIVN